MEEQTPIQEVTTSTTGQTYTFVSPAAPVSRTLSGEEFKAWLQESLIFSVALPCVIVFLTSLSGNGLDVRSAAIAMCYAGVSALTNLLMKFSKGV